LDLRSLVNPLFTEGSVVSMAASIPVLRNLHAGEAVLLMDGDVLYPKPFLPRLIGSPHRTALLIDRNYSNADDDPVLVPVANGKPFDFVKRWEGAADLVDEEGGLLERGEVAAPVEGLVEAQVRVVLLAPAPRRPDDLAREDGAADRHRQRFDSSAGTAPRRPGEAVLPVDAGR